MTVCRAQRENTGIFHFARMNNMTTSRNFSLKTPNSVERHFEMTEIVIVLLKY